MNQQTLAVWLCIAALLPLTFLTTGITGDTLLPTAEELTGEPGANAQADILAHWLSTAVILASILFLTATFLAPNTKSEWLLAFTVTLIMLGGFEAALHLQPDILGYSYANYVRPNYDSGAMWVYENDSRLMIPNNNNTLYYNGYWWNHSTDDYGFRNPETYEDPDIILLGDSHIYGFGLEQDETIAQQLRDKTGETVLNMARTGDTIYQQIRFITAYKDKFNPDHIFHFYYHNDIRDINRVTSQDDRETFINTPVADIQLPTNPTEITKQPPYGQDNRIIPRFRTMFAITYFALDIDEAGRERFPRSCRYRMQQWDYLEHGLTYLNHVATNKNATLTIAPIIDHGSYRQQHVQNRRLKQIANNLNAAYLNISDITQNTANRLPHDNHLNADAHRLIAERITTHLDEQR